MPTNLYGPNDNFDFEKSHVLPALIRKIHLAHLLEENREKEVLKDLNVDNLKEAHEILTQIGVSKEAVEIWGTGKPKREFLWSEDMADACVFLMENQDFENTYRTTEKEIRNTHINIGTGIDISIKELAQKIKKRIGFQGSLNFNSSKLDGTMRKVTDVSKIHSLGWKHTVDLDVGIKKLYDWYLLKNNE
jgi:GDP-L-fucose synthase